MANTQEYRVLVTYAVSIEGHDSYCSGNEDVDWVKLAVRHRYHQLECGGMEIFWLSKGGSEQNKIYNVKRCIGRGNINAEMVKDRPHLYFHHMNKNVVVSKFCSQITAEVSGKIKEKFLCHRLRNQIPQNEPAIKFPLTPLDISEFAADSNWKLELTDEDLQNIAKNIGHCRAEVVTITKDELKLPTDYNYMGVLFNRDRLYDLFALYWKTTESCGNGSFYCEGDQGIYYIPIRAILLKK